MDQPNGNQVNPNTSGATTDTGPVPLAGEIRNQENATTEVVADTAVQETAPVTDQYQEPEITDGVATRGIAGNLLSQLQPIIEKLKKSINSVLKSFKKTSTETEKTKLPPQVTVNEVKPKVEVSDSTPRKGGTKRLFNYLILLLFLCAAPILFYIAMVVTNIDTEIFSLTLKGRITDADTENAIADAEIFINDNLLTKTDANGNYSVGDLNLGNILFKVSKEGYQPKEESIEIQRGILNYTIEKNYALNSMVNAGLSGRLIAPDPNYNFRNDKIVLNGEEHVISTDGTFVIEKVAAGEASLQFLSPNFKDLEQSITLNSGSNQLEDIILEPTGDIVGEVVSWVREDIVLGTKFNIENVSDDQIEIKDNGDFRIKDLEIGRLYRIRTSADGYKTRDYELTPKQGNNDLFGFKMVEEGRAVYLYKQEGARNNQFFTADLDGVGEKAVTNFTSFNVRFEFYDSVTDKLFYLTDRDRVRGVDRTIFAVNEINLENNNVVNLTTTAGNIQTLFPNMRGKILANVYSPRNSTSNNLEVVDFSGLNPKAIGNLDDIDYNNVFISDNRNYIFYTEGRIDEEVTAKLYRSNINNPSEKELLVERRDINVYDTSEDGNLIIFSAVNDKTNLTDLHLYNFNNKETRLVDENLDGKQYQFLNGDNNKIFFIAEREDRTNIYSYDINQNRTEKITNMPSDETIRDLYQQEKYAFYISNRGLYVIDLRKPNGFKQVNGKQIEYTGYGEN